MKKVILIFLLLVGLNAFSQRREMNDMTPEQYASLATKKMILALDLNESQQAMVYQMSLENGTTLKRKMEERKKLTPSDQIRKPSADER